MSPDTDMLDAYISEDIPPEKRPGTFDGLRKLVYGDDLITQPLCPQCARPLYYHLNRRTGKIELYCSACDDN